MFEIILREVAKEQKWDDAKMWSLALSFFRRREQKMMEGFVSYVVRAAKNENEMKAKEAKR